MSDTNYTFAIDERILEKFKRRSELEHRTMAGQLRALIEAWVNGDIEVKEDGK